MTNKYYCPCCGSSNTAVSYIEKVTSDDPIVEGETWTKVEIWCYNCSDLIGCSLEVPESFESAPDIGAFNIMEPLARHLKEKED